MSFVIEDALADLAAEVQRISAGQDQIRHAIAKLTVLYESIAAVRGDLKAQAAQQHTVVVRQVNVVGEAVGATLNAVQGLSIHTASIAHALAGFAAAGAAKTGGRANGAANDMHPPGAA